MLINVTVQFDNKKFDYTTQVNGHKTDKQINHFFVGNSYNVGTFPQEILRRCTKVHIYRPKTNF